MISRLLLKLQYLKQCDIGKLINAYINSEVHVYKYIQLVCKKYKVNSRKLKFLSKLEKENSFQQIVLGQMNIHFQILSLDTDLTPFIKFKSKQSIDLSINCKQ